MLENSGTERYKRKRRNSQHHPQINSILMSKPHALFRHIHFKGLTRFAHPQRLQEKFAREFLDYKASPTTRPPPTPAIITFQALPVYTTGRRENGTLSEEHIARLTAPYEYDVTKKLSLSSEPKVDPEVWPTQRGGQITFHGPGQITICPILDLKAAYPLWPKGLSPRCYVNLLEQATINTLACWNLQGIRTENPGVWAEDGERKIAALGVHLRRNITSYGVGLNVRTDLGYFDRIVACGLEGKQVTSMKMLMREKKKSLKLAMQENRHPSPSTVGRGWIVEFFNVLYGGNHLPELVEEIVIGGEF